jgi:hypothetical protein
MQHSRIEAAGSMYDAVRAQVANARQRQPHSGGKLLSFIARRSIVLEQASIPPDVVAALRVGHLRVSLRAWRGGVRLRLKEDDDDNDNDSEIKFTKLSASTQAQPTFLLLRTVGPAETFYGELIAAYLVHPTALARIRHASANFGDQLLLVMQRWTRAPDQQSTFCELAPDREPEVYNATAIESAQRVYVTKYLLNKVLLHHLF